MNQRLVYCIIYSHVWALNRLDLISGLGSLSKTAVVEVAINSNLGVAFIDPMKSRLGVGGLLRNNMNLHDIVEAVPGLNYPVAFAPKPPIPVGALSSAVGLLASCEGDFDKVLLMIHSQEAMQLNAALSSADRYFVMWDLADAPTRALAQVGEALAAQRVLGPDQWGGIHLYTDPRRRVTNEEHARQTFESILGQYPDLKVSRPDESKAA